MKRLIHLMLGVMFFPATVLADIGIEYGTHPTLGFFFLTSEEEYLGWYVDLKVSLPRIESKHVYKYNKNYAESVLHDSYKGDRRSLAYLDIGRTKRIYEKIHGYVALGIGSETLYRKYNDKFGILGNNSDYYIEDGTSVITNFQVGAFVTFDKLGLKVSYDTFSKATSFGLSGKFSTESSVLFLAFMYAHIPHLYWIGIPKVPPVHTLEGFPPHK